MPTSTISKRLAQEGDFILVPRKEYEALVESKKIKEFTPTVAQKKALAQAEHNLARGKTLSYDELIRKMGFAS